MDVEEPLTPQERVAIANMSRSQSECVNIGVFNDCNADAILTEARTAKDSGVEHSLTALIAWHLARSLSAYPDMHSTIRSDNRVRRSDVNLGVAIDGPGGTLTAPVIHKADTLSLPELGSQIAELRTRAHTNALRPSDLRGGGFTLSNIGMAMTGGHGVGVIPPGQGGLLTIGGAYRAPVVRNDRVDIGTQFPLSLTFDHRVANGMYAWTFFADLVRRFELLSSKQA